jgi:hypothetical protein
MIGDNVRRIYPTRIQCLPENRTETRQRGERCWVNQLT